MQENEPVELFKLVELLRVGGGGAGAGGAEIFGGRCGVYVRNRNPPADYELIVHEPQLDRGCPRSMKRHGPLELTTTPNSSNSLNS